MKLSILIPVYNEEDSILNILNELKKVNLINDIEKQIILIDDCSLDNSKNIIDNFILNNNDLDILVESHTKNKGKGAAIQTGIKIASGDIIVIQDADLEYDPKEFNLLINPIINGKADVVYGSRFIGGNPHRILFFWHTIGNKFLTFISNAFTNLNLTDMETCYKMFRKEIIEKITINENRFGIEPEITAKISKIPDIRIYEVGISYYGRTYKEGKKIGLKDAFRALYCIVKYNLFV
ncbi:MAG: glycosyltransferase family 2 protein [Flavobacteriaceae bacterium]